VIDYEMMCSSATQKVALLFFQKNAPPQYKTVFSSKKANFQTGNWLF
jgi:hypothetical protein